MTGTEAEVRELRKMQFFGRKRVGNSRVEFDATMRVLALCDAWEAQQEALRNAPTPEMVSHDKVGARAYARWYDGRLRAALAVGVGKE